MELQLSVANASVARLAPCGAIWLYDRTEGIDARDPVAEQLRWASKEGVDGDVNCRHIRRQIVVYVAGEVPGVELVIVEADRELSAIVPSREERATAKKLWNATDFPREQLLPSTLLAFMSLADFEGLPGAAVQLAAFRCGGYAVSVKLTHCLSDALCLMRFVYSWEALSRVFFGDAAQSAIPTGADHVGPSFDPSLLDRYANLTAESTAPDPEKIVKARALPMHRFDWWAADAPGYPSWATASSNATKPSAEELPHLQLSLSTLPLADEGHGSPRSARTDPLRDRGTSEDEAGSRCKPAGSSGGTADFAARRGTCAYLDSHQPRATPSRYQGPGLSGYNGRAPQERGPAIAGWLRRLSDPAGTMSKFTADAVSSYLYDAAHGVSPQRLWQGLLGSRHTLVERAYEVDFCATRWMARYAQGVMPCMDGLVQVIDVADTGGFDVSVCLEKETLHSFIQEPLPRAFEQRVRI
ncbi:hypothetical protein DL765_002596 [Monosporascus sp. GIB2]|nr:hypothetical protein DL765_002596 [Monosporascus sp. GIB2]